MANTYEPQSFTKDGRAPQVADTLREYYQLLWDGWTPAGAAPERPRSAIPAYLSDVDRVDTHSRYVYALGDSTSNQAVQADVTVGHIKTSMAQYQGRSWQLWALLASESRWTFDGTYAQAGAFSSGLMPLLEELIADKPPGGTIVILAGHNGHEADATIDLHERAREAGFRTVMAITPPHSGASLAKVQNFHQRLKNYASTKGIPIADCFSVLVDPATGNFLPSMDSGDGIHPSAAGYRAMGEAIGEVLNGLYQTPLRGPLHNASFTGSLKPNPLALDDQIAYNHYHALASLGSGSAASVSRPDFAGGKALRLTRGDTDLNVVASIPSLNEGDRIRLFFAMSVNLQGGGGWGMRLESHTVGLKNAWALGFPAVVLDSVPDSRFYVDLTMQRTDTFRLPRIFLSGAGSTMDLGELNFLNLTAMGAA